MEKENPTKLLYYVEYSQKLAGGGRLNVRSVMSEKELSWYFTNYSERFDYVIHLARIATPEEIEKFAPKYYEEE